MKRNLIENLAIQSNIPSDIERDWQEICPMYLTIRQQLMIWSFASQIIDSRFSLIALTARLVMAFVLRAMVCTYTDFLCTFV